MREQRERASASSRGTCSVSSISSGRLSFSTPAIMDLGSVAKGGPTSAGMVTDNDTTMTTNANADKPEEEEIDPIWLSSRTARQIYGLCQVEKVSIRHHHPSPSIR